MRIILPVFSVWAIEYVAALEKERNMSQERDMSFLQRSELKGRRFKCDMAPEIVFVHDVTNSQEAAIDSMREALPEFFKVVEDMFGSHLKFGFTSFKDKYHPATQWADEGDYCAALHQPLVYIGGEDRERIVEDIQKKYADLNVGGGRDLLDGFSEGMLRAAASRLVGWSEEKVDPVTERPIVRIMVGFTDIPSHPANKRLDKETVELPRNNIAEDFSLVDNDIDALCRDLDFPMGADIGLALRKRNIVPLMITGSTGRRVNAVQKLVWFFQEIGKMDEETGTAVMDITTGVRDYMRWYFKTEAQTPAAIELGENDLSDVIAQLTSVLSQMEERFCELAGEVIQPTQAPNHSTDDSNGGANQSSSSATSTDDTHTDGDGQWGTAGLAVGSAAAGLAAVGTAAYMLVHTRFFAATPSTNQQPRPQIDQDVDNDCEPEPREQQEAIRGGLFS